MKGIIIYKTNTGSTGEYASWLAEATGFDPVDVKRAKAARIRDCDVVVMGCPVYAGNPLLSKWIRKNWTALADKKLYFFTTSGAAAGDPEVKAWYEKAFTAKERSRMTYFPLGGRMKYAELNPFMRFMMRMGSKMVKDPAEREKMFAEFDRVERRGLDPVIDSIRAGR